MISCFHCGLPVLEPGRHRALLLGAERELCCAGCEAVASTIAAGGFERYYESRTAQPARPALHEGVPFAEPECAEASLILERVTCGACLWLIENLGKDGKLDANELELLAFLQRESPLPHPELAAFAARHGVAA